MRSAQALQKASVTGFRDHPHAPYVGSTLWILFLVSFESASFASNDWSSARTLAATAIACNVAAYAFQSIDYVHYHFEFWPVTALNWTAQLSAIGVASAAVGHSFVDRDRMLWLALLHLFAQTLFTASQFAVTLEFFKRALSPLPLPVGRHVPRGRHG